MQIALDYFTQDDNAVIKHEVYLSKPTDKGALDDFVFDVLKKNGSGNRKCVVRVVSDECIFYMTNYNPETDTFFDFSKVKKCSITSNDLSNDDIEDVLVSVGMLKEGQKLSTNHIVWREPAHDAA